MRLKLTHKEFKALYAILNAVAFLKDIHPLSDEGLQQTTLQALRQRFYHLDAIQRKDYRIKLSIQETQAFWLWFKEHEYDDMSHEGNLLNTICRNIFLHFDTKPHIYEGSDYISKPLLDGA